MNDNFILSLIEKFAESSIASLELWQGDDFISLRKGEALERGQAQGVREAQAEAASAPAAMQGEGAKGLARHEAEGAKGMMQGLLQIKSPIVGTFYRAPSPDSPVYVEEGSRVKKGDPICILEAMKMMNTLESELDCTIEKILVQNGDLVEYDQPLFLVRKAQ